MRTSMRTRLDKQLQGNRKCFLQTSFGLEYKLALAQVKGCETDPLGLATRCAEAATWMKIKQYLGLQLVTWKDLTAGCSVWTLL